MRKIFLLLLVFIFTNNLQIDAQISIKAGVVKSNAILKNISFDNLYESKIDPLFAGVYYRLAPLNIVGFETGIQYTGLVEKVSDSGIQFDIKNHYLSIPVSVNLKPNSFLSPGAGILFSSLVDSNLDELLNQKTVDVSAFLKVNINPFKKLGLEVGYNLGFFPFAEWDNVDQGGITINTSTIQNRYFYAAAVLKI